MTAEVVCENTPLQLLVVAVWRNRDTLTDSDRTTKLRGLAHRLDDLFDGAAAEEDQLSGAVVLRLAAIASMATRSSGLTLSPFSR